MLAQKQPPFKECVIAHRSRGRKYPGLKYRTEVAACVSMGRGAYQTRRRFTVRRAGAFGSENAGMSSEKNGENPFHRKPKVSRTTLVGPG